MKTFLLLAGLSCNIFLCYAPFEKAEASTETVTPVIAPQQSTGQKNISERKAIAYSDLLKNKVFTVIKN